MTDEEWIEQDPNDVGQDDLRERARLIFAQWHVDEVTSPTEAKDYANRLLERMAEYGLTVARNQPLPALCSCGEHDCEPGYLMCPECIRRDQEDE
jgi:hypothetical protein